MRASQFVFAAIAGFGVFAAGALAAADGPPMRRSGLWETHMTGDGMGAGGRGMAMRQCVDPGTEQRRGVFSAPANRREPDNCPVREFHRTASGFAFHSVCTDGGATTTSNGTVVGDFSSQYRLDITTQRTPGGSARHMSMEARWLGACPAGERPGDLSMVLPDGRVMHMGAGMGPGTMGRPN